MTERSVQLEREKVRKIAREYTKRGYKVFFDANDVKNNLPDILKETGFIPDMIALRDDKGIVFEVKSRRSIKNSNQTSRIANALENSKNWKFVFVYTNPRNDIVDEQKILSDNRLMDNLYQLENIYRQAQSNIELGAVFLMFWGLLEALLRRELNEGEEHSAANQALSLVRDAVMQGIVSRQDYSLLRELLDKRNQVAHGYDQNVVTPTDVKMLLSISRSLLQGPSA